jgi:hypothetical protein
LNEGTALTETVEALRRIGRPLASFPKVKLVEHFQLFRLLQNEFQIWRFGDVFKIVAIVKYFEQILMVQMNSRNRDN